MKQFPNTTSNVLEDLHSICDGYCRYPYSDPAILEDRCSHCGVYLLLKQYSVQINQLKKQVEAAECCIVEIEDALHRGTGNDCASDAVAKYEKKKENQIL